MEREKGLEPSTFAMATRRSSQLSYSRDRRDIKEYGLSDFLSSILQRGTQELQLAWQKLSRAWKPAPYATAKRRHHQRRAAEASEADRQARALIKQRPARLQDDFVMVDDDAMLDQVFLRLRRQFCYPANSGTQVLPRRAMLREMGRIEPDRLYFFLKPLNERGFLFERAGSGWLVSKAEKIVGRDTFIRSGEPWDRVTLYQGRDGQVSGPRISSERLGVNFVSFAVYEQKLRQVFEQELAS